MQRHKGIGASPGIAIGRAFPIVTGVAVSAKTISRYEVDAEISRLTRALWDTDRQLEDLQRQLSEERSGVGHDIVEAHRLMLKSPELAEEIPRVIREEQIGAAWAVRRTLDRLRAAFAALGDPYFRERGSDVEAVADRLLRTLLGMPDLRPEAGAPIGSIAVGTELSPLDPLQFKRAGIIAIVTQGGGTTSHAAILCRALGIPYVAGVVNLPHGILPGARLLVDGGRGEVILDPDEEAERASEAIAAANVARAELLASKKALPAVTSDGVHVHLAANVESLSEIETAVALGAQSIGLFRTEFLYLERPELPTEEEQYVDAVAGVRSLAGRQATFRTLDLGGDKVSACIERPRGANPALGVRSIRLSLIRQDIFRTQLRALYRAAAIGPIRILLPLISGVTELAQARAICREVCAELAAEGVAHDPTIPIGAMIETPSAALTVDHLASACDFFSIGTNDLIQYAFAADRANEEVAALYQPHHPAVLRLLKQAIEAAHAAGKPVAICGDMAGQPLLTLLLLGLGLRDLSMTPRQIALVKAVVRAFSMREAEELTRRALALGSEVEVGKLLHDTMTERSGLDLEESEISGGI
jgi:phosphotransferase system enzyme I (PtsI)